MADGFFLFADCSLQWREGPAAKVLFLWVLSGAFADALGGWTVCVGKFYLKADGDAAKSDSVCVNSGYWIGLLPDFAASPGFLWRQESFL